MPKNRTGHGFMLPAHLEGVVRALLLDLVSSAREPAGSDGLANAMDAVMIIFMTSGCCKSEPRTRPKACEKCQWLSRDGDDREIGVDDGRGVGLGGDKHGALGRRSQRTVGIALEVWGITDQHRDLGSLALKGVRADREHRACS